MRLAMLVGALALGWATAAAAAPITATYDITATFATGPNPTVSAILGVTYDPTTSGAVTVNSFSSAVLGGDGPVTGYFNESDGFITFGDNCPASICSADSSKSQFVDRLVVDAGLPTSGGPLIYTDSSFGHFFLSQSETVTQAATAVPEPSALALLGLPVALLALLTVRRPRQGALTA